MVEYALLIGLIALVVIAGAILLGDSLVSDFSDFGSEIEHARNGPGPTRHHG